MGSVYQLGTYQIQIMCPLCGWAMSGRGEKSVVECLKQECKNYHKLFEFEPPRIALKEIAAV